MLDGSPAAMISQLQSSAGNAAVARLLGPAAAAPAVEYGTRVERLPFQAAIRREAGAGRASEGAPALSASRSDAGPGEEHGEELRGLFEVLGGTASNDASPPQNAPPTTGSAEAAAPAVPAPAAETDTADGVPVRLPDIELPILAEVGKSDAVKGALTYTSTIKNEGAAPSGFGVTRSFASKLTGVTVTPKTNLFEVSATLEHPITYQVRATTGPEGQKDIASETDAKLTKTNYPKVHTDLTPDMSDLNGRPPRDEYWAKDLTLTHELVHAKDDNDNGPAAMATAKTWLDGQTAADATGVQAHLTKIPGRFAAALLAALSTEDGEKHAYGDGAPLYKARADKIKEKGEKGDYK